MPETTIVSIPKPITQAEFDAKFNAKTTDDLPEGSTTKYLTAQQKADLMANPALYIAFEKLATAPTPSEGRIYYDTVLTKVRLYKDSAWVDAAISADELEA